MNNKQIVTRLDGKIVCALLEDNEIVQIDCERENQVSILQNIYIGKVKNIVDNIQSAFIEIGGGQICYYSLIENRNPFFTSKFSKKNGVCVGDELLVQVSKEALKTKLPVVTSELTMIGKNVIINTKKDIESDKELFESSVFISNKWTNENDKNKIKSIIKSRFKEENITDYSCIIRTNAQNASANQIFSEIKILIAKLDEIKNSSKNRTCYSCLYMPPAPYIQNVEENNSDEIITDCEYLYDSLVSYFTSKNRLIQIKTRSTFAKGADALYAKCHTFGETNIQSDNISIDKKLIQKDMGLIDTASNENLDNNTNNLQNNTFSVKYYDDKLLSLNKLYSIESAISKAFKEQVWLNSGGYLVIQPTEALTVIDVNTGKAITGKNDVETTFLKLNLEAAKEAIKQIRLRNISGIIIIDFISLRNFKNKEILINELKSLCKLDTVKTTVVDITKLDLVEITRKKIKKTLYEQWH